jgi:hypothetical protein
VALLPLALLTLIALVVYTRLRWLTTHDLSDERIKSRRRALVSATFLRLVLFSLFLVWPGVSARVLAMFACIRLPTLSSSSSSSTATQTFEDYLVDDLRYTCYGHQWKSYLGVDILFIVMYPIGVPCMFFALLYMNRLKLSEAQTKLSLGFIYEGSYLCLLTCT